MDCKNWREMASDYIEGTLEAPAAADAMRRHAAECADCRADEAMLRSLSRELNVLPGVEPPLFFRENLISAIERGDQGAKRPIAESLWRTLFPRLGRTALGTLVAGGACAALLWSLVLPHLTTGGRSSYIAGGPLVGLLPGLSGDSVDTANAQKEPPRLRIGRVTTVLPDEGPVYDFSLWLENADKGTARFQLVGDKHNYRFNLGSGMAAQTLRVPLAAAQGGSTIDLAVRWTADGKSHSKYLFVPVPRTDDRAVDRKQSFGLPESTITESAKQVAVRYSIPVTLEELPENTGSERVMMDARNETASEALRRNLAGRNLKVAVSGAGILVTADKGSAP